MAYHPKQMQNAAGKADDDRDPGLAIPTKITASQQSVLDQLHNHVAFSESLIFLSGPQGAGKTTLLEVFLEQASDYANLAYQPGGSTAKASALRSKLLRQLVSLDAYSTDDSLLEALQRNIKKGRQHLVVCIDDGANVPSQILQELQELVSSRHLFDPEQRISVIISGESQWVKRASKGLALGASESPVVIDIPAFFKREQQWFARKLAATQADHSDSPQRSEQQVSDWLAQTQGYPGQIQAVLEQELLQRPHTEQAIQARRARLQQKPNPSDEPSAPKLKGNQLLITLVVVAALIAVAVAWWLQQQKPSTTNNASAPLTQVSETPVEPEPEADGTQQSSQADDSELDEDAANANTVMPFDQAMARLRERADERPAARDIQFQLVQPLNHLREDAQANAENSIEDADPSTNAALADVVDTSIAAEAEAVADAHPYASEYDNQALWQRDPNRYVFQLAAFNDRARLLQFLAGFNHPDMAIYQTLRNDQTWFMVVLGDYPDADSARDYLATNSDLQSMQPWLKAVRLVQEDLAPVMQSSAQDSTN